MSQVTTLDAAELKDWLWRVSQTVDRSLREPARGEVMASLREGLEDMRIGLPLLAMLVLLDDCLRVAHLAIEADGVIDAEELARIADLVEVAAPRYAAVLPRYQSFSEGARSLEEIARFFRVHRVDPGPFGHASPSEWRGLQLVRTVELQTRNAEPLRDHERMLARIMDEVFAGRSTDVEREARRRLRKLFAPAATPSLDPRAVAFCRDDGPEVFASVAHSSQIHTRDPFDVESIHAEARATFQSQLERANTPAQQQGQGRTLLILGESGSGKTHLLRALRTQVHAQRMGYVGYLQMTADVGDYARYVLRSLIDSMERPYDAPVAAESGLMYLSDGLAEGRSALPAEELDRLRTADLPPDQIDAVVGALVDRIVRTPGLDQLEVDLLHALLLLQRRDPALQRRVVKYLRCEPLGSHDRKLLGGLAARDQPEDPLRTLRQLGAIMFELQQASMVLLVDQIEDVVPDGKTATRIQQAFDSLRAIADSIPSAVVVIACMTDVYIEMKPKLSRSLVDRLEHEPPVRLTSEREAQEIEQMLTRRLEHLFAAFDVAWREDDPLYPFIPAQIDAVRRLRARDCLAQFRQYHATSIAKGSPSPIVPGEVAAPAAAQAASLPDAPRPEVGRAWNDALASVTEAPGDDAEILAVVAEALRGAAGELGVKIELRTEREGRAEQLAIAREGTARRLATICNQGAQGGHLGKKLEQLRAHLRAGITPIAMRSSDWKFPPKTATAKQIGEFLQAGGQTLTLMERELRAVYAARKLTSANPPGLDEWRRSERPLSQLSFVRALLDHDRISAETPAVAPTVVAPVAAAVAAGPPSVSTPPVAAPPPAPRPAATFDPGRVRLGTTTTMRAEPITLPVEEIKTHVAFLGTTGSGKTTAALNVAEQLLERGVSVLLVDRKGDLARYASESWWNDPASPDRTRKVALRRKIDVDLFTPGNSQGRPLRLPLIPSLADATPQERDQIAAFAASGLGAMMGYGSSTTHGHKESILQAAITLHAADREVTIEVLSDTISRPDPELLQSVGVLQRFFAPLSEDLQSLKIQRGALLSGAGEALDVNALIPVPGGRPRLSIINMSALAEVSVLQFWVSRLLIELARLSRKRPSGTLQGVTFFDEADTYVPAMSVPPTKEPMFDLLRRARSGGIGILLATQNPGDFDYKARDLIGSWLVGKVGSDRAIEKMRNLLGSYPNVSTRLASQPTGNFFVLTPGKTMEVKCDRALMQTDQMPENEVTELARSSTRRS